jgi:hypothetical protein
MTRPAAAASLPIDIFTKRAASAYSGAGSLNTSWQRLAPKTLAPLIDGAFSFSHKPEFESLAAQTRGRF